MNEEEAFYGEEGDDRIFAGRQTKGNVLLDGGSGDDYLVAGWAASGPTTIIGGSGRDEIITNFFE